MSAHIVIHRFVYTTFSSTDERSNMATFFLNNRSHSALKRRHLVSHLQPLFQMAAIHFFSCSQEISCRYATKITANDVRIIITFSRPCTTVKALCRPGQSSLTIELLFGATPSDSHRVPLLKHFAARGNLLRGSDLLSGATPPESHSSQHRVLRSIHFAARGNLLR